jgi:hypothetical protein
MNDDDDSKPPIESKVIQLKSRTKPKAQTAALKMLRIADEIDGIILRHMEAGDIEPKELAGLLSHRLGSLMKNIENKQELIDLCVDVLRKQAAGD